MAKLIYKGLKANLPETRENALYFVTDTREVYFGSDLYAEGIRFFTGSNPTNPAQGVLYINETTGNGYALKNGSLVTVFTGLKGIKEELIGNAQTDTKDSNTIEGAKRYADYVKTTLEGSNSDTDESTTIAGAKKYADKKASDLLGNANDTSDKETVRGARALANEKVASISAGNNGVAVSVASPASTTAPAISLKLSPKTGNSLAIETGAGEEGLFAHVPVISMARKATANDGFTASYELTVDGVATGDVINIPKDYLVKGASVDTVVEADKAAGGKFENNTGFSVGDKYLDFVINTKADGDSTAENDTHIYINVADLAHIYTAGNGIDVNANDVISIVIDPNNANGLSVSANGIALAQATDNVTGAMTAADHVKLTAAYEAVQIGTF